jgi:hypothetical protein
MRMHDRHAASVGGTREQGGLTFMVEWETSTLRSVMKLSIDRHECNQDISCVRDHHGEHTYGVGLVRGSDPGLPMELILSGCP